MKKLLPFFILVLSFSVSGQPGTRKYTPVSEITITKKPARKPKCALNLTDSPVLRGLRLGMTVSETAQLFGKAGEDLIFNQSKLSEDSSVKIAFDSEMLKKVSGFYSVKSLTLEFYGGKLYKIDIRYSEEEVKFSSNKQFAENISEKLNLKLQKKAWVYHTALLSGGGSLKCREFQLDVQYAFNEIVLIDLTATKTMENKEEEKRRNFKP